MNWTHSQDYKYVYYSTAGPETTAWRVKLADRQLEMITSLKKLVRAAGPGGGTDIGVAPDGSLLFTRDVGTHEICAIAVKWP
jgi:hypothetical protein